MCEKDMREQRAFENMCTAIDKQEIYERVSIRAHKSFLPHGAVYKVTKDILEIADTTFDCYTTCGNPALSK